MNGRASVKISAACFAALVLTGRLIALGDPGSVAFHAAPGFAPLVEAGHAAPIVVDTGDWPGVTRAAGDFCADVKRVTGHRPALLASVPSSASFIVIAGTVGHSQLIDGLIRAGKLNVRSIAGRWEADRIQGVQSPFPGIDRAVVIAGSDKRGTIYGLYGLSEQMGVSPWYWWADVPPTRHAAVYLSLRTSADLGPAVRYRGIFLNDEAPALSGWSQEKFGGFNHQFYGHVYELLLRLGANYLWPAMWNNCFAEDDPKNPRLADEYGIVMGTSHVEPMMRADKEWNRAGYSEGDWNYLTHAPELRKFWEEGIARTQRDENVITIAMRGKIDTPMSPTANISLLQRIVADQRKIIARHPGIGGAEAPQMWALYKEVQDYYEMGMRVPDDVTLLWCDDNWGNLRRLPTAAERGRSGGAGVYYHFDYVGGPRSYKWLNTYPITKVWEQMHLAWRYGADRLWIVNVGDLKPMEFPLDFFLSYARHPESLPYERLPDFERDWAARQFGPEHAAEIADLIAGYTKFNGRRKPEQLSPDTYSLVDYDEASRAVDAYSDLAHRSMALAAQLPAEDQAAYFQLVGYPVQACAAVNELYLAVAQNHLWAAQGRASAAGAAKRARFWFKRDAKLAKKYNREERGRWDHLMDQSHIGYTGWHDPPANIMPALAATPAPHSGIGVAVEGKTHAWMIGSTDAASAPALPVFTPYGGDRHWFELFRRGRQSLSFILSASAPWIAVTPLGSSDRSKGKLGPDTRYWVQVDFSRLPPGVRKGAIALRTADGASVELSVTAEVPALTSSPRGFVESNGYISIEAPHYDAAIAAAPFRWETMPDFGRTLSAVALHPVIKDPPAWSPNAPHLEYRTTFTTAGDVTVRAAVAPTLPFQPDRKLRCAVSFDDETPQIVDLSLKVNSRPWEKAVSDGVNVAVTHHKIATAGVHVLKWWVLDPAIVLEKIVVDAGGLKPSYLGPPESQRL
ncbi:MAG TPA: glycosyl hydrolase 115 family protein [Opitutaceae bacterium]|jgi:hypothetical protein